MVFDKRSKVSDVIPSSSMADIAFLLLVFFLVTTVFPKDQGLAVVLPAAETTQPVSPGNVLHMTVLPTGLIEVRHGDDPSTRVLSAAHLTAVWTMAVASNARLIAAVKTHPDAPYGHMVDVLDALKEAGAQRISLQQANRR